MTSGYHPRYMVMDCRVWYLHLSISSVHVVNLVCFNKRRRNRTKLAEDKTLQLSAANQVKSFHPRAEYAGRHSNGITACTYVRVPHLPSCAHYTNLLTVVCRIFLPSTLYDSSACLSFTLIFLSLRTGLLGAAVGINSVSLFLMK